MRTTWWIVVLVVLLAVGLAVAAAAGAAAAMRSRVDAAGSPPDLQQNPWQFLYPAPGGDNWYWMMPDGRWYKEMPGPGRRSPGFRQQTPTPQETPVPF